MVQDAAKTLIQNSPSYEQPIATYAPPDMWNRQKDTGKTMADIFFQNGVSIVKADNNRVQGHMILKDMMSPMPLNDPYVKGLFPEGKCPASLPGIMFFNDLRTEKDGVVKDVVEDIESIQADEKNPNDCAKEPHDVTHSVDMCRYYAIMRVRKAAGQQKKKRIDPLKFLFEEKDETEENYQEYMCGGEITDNYMS